MIEFLNALVRGTQVGAIYALLGLGVNIIYLATGVFNFAHGAIFMVGGMLGVTLWTSYELPFALAVALVIVATAAIGAATEVVAVRPTHRFKHATVLWVISTLGVSIVVESITKHLVYRSGDGTGIRPFPSYLNWEAIDIGGVLILPQRAIIVPIAIALTAVIAIFFRRTLWGRALAAMAFDREAAAMRGVPVSLLALVAFALGSGVAGFAGVMVGPVTQANVDIGFGLMLQGFIAATIGGIPKLWGPILGGVILGVALQLTTVYVGAELASVVSLMLLLTVLTLRPQGILGRTVRTV